MPELSEQGRIAVKWAGKGVLLGQIGTLVIALIALTFLSFHDMWDYNTKLDLNQAYKALVTPGTRPASFPDKAGVEAALAKGDPKLVVLEQRGQDGYHYLRAHGGHAGTVYVEDASKTHLALVGRNGHEKIEELDATITRSGPVVKDFRTLYSGHVGWSSYGWTVFGFSLFFSLMGALFGSIYGLEEETKRARWRAVVADQRIGPKKPQVGFGVLWPYSEDQGGQIVMSVKKLVWTKVKDYERWQEDKAFDAERDSGLKPVEIAADVGTTGLSGQWFDFCARVAAVNAQRWRQLETKRQLGEILSGQPEAKIDGPSPTAILAPAGLLMTEALDSQPLPLDS